jgi:OOP family OmpA-OmpF porin
MSWRCLSSCDGKLRVGGLRDPLAVDPTALLGEMGIDRTHIVAHWVPYQGLDPEIVLKRLVASLDPPPSVTLAIAGNRIVAQGSALFAWLERARIAARALPAGAPALGVSRVQNVNDGVMGRLREAIPRAPFASKPTSLFRHRGRT